MHHRDICVKGIGVTASINDGIMGFFVGLDGNATVCVVQAFITMFNPCFCHFLALLRFKYLRKNFSRLSVDPPIVLCFHAFFWYPYLGSGYFPLEWSHMKP